MLLSCAAFPSQMVGSLKMNGTARTGAFTADGTQLLTSGGDGTGACMDSDEMLAALTQNHGQHLQFVERHTFLLAGTSRAAVAGQLCRAAAHAC